MDAKNPNIMFISLRNRYSYLFAIIIGAVLQVLAFPRVGISYFAWICLIPLLWVSETASLRKTIWFSYLYGVIFFAGLMYWIVFVTAVGSVILVLYLAIYFPLFSVSIRLIRRILKIPYIVSAPFIFCFCEYLRSIVMTGLPWDMLGYALYPDSALIQIVEFTGVSGLTFLVVLGNAVAYCVIKQGYVLYKKYGTKWYMGLREQYSGVTVLIVFVLCIAGIRLWGTGQFKAFDSADTTKSIKIALIQANIAQMEKWDAVFKGKILHRYDTLTRKSAQKKPDLIVWSESSLPGFFQYDEKSTFTIFSLRKDLKIPLLFGGNRFERGEQEFSYYNSAYYVVPDNDTPVTYDKIHLVPYGEYIPNKKFLTKIFPKLDSVVPFEDFSSGNPSKKFHLNGIPFGISICFEDIFPDVIRDIALSGALFMVNITNDAWYKRSSAPYQHFDMDAFRAIENRIPSLRCANTGITGWVAPSGRSTIFYGSGGSPIFESGYMIAEIPILVHTPTFFTKYGDVFLYGCSVVSAILLLFSGIYYVGSRIFKLKG